MGRKKGFKFYHQLDAMDCGATCLRMIFKHYGKVISIDLLRELNETTKEGANFTYLAKAAEDLGFRTLAVKISYEQLWKEAPMPCILHWNQNHFVVAYRVEKDSVYIADPAHGKVKLTIPEFMGSWAQEENEGIALLFEPTDKLHAEDDEPRVKKKSALLFLMAYLKRQKRLSVQLFLGLFAASIIQLIFPFLTQSLVDVGVQQENLKFVYLLLLAQLMLFIGRTGIEIIRKWITLHISTRISVSLISDFFMKLMQLPIAYFDTKHTGDLMQRIQDHKRIDELLTGSSLNVLFSMFNLVVFGIVLLIYDYTIFAVFFFGSVFYVILILLFLQKREVLDYKNFNQLTREKSKTIELINGMQEIKLHNAEQKFRWDWEHLRAKLFKIEIKSVRLELIQSSGGQFINEAKNILATFLAASLVISGEITLGMMLSISYIIGQMNGPLAQLIDFIHAAQDTKISLERLMEIHSLEGETSMEGISLDETNTIQDIELKEVSFRYKGTTKPVLEGINLTVPKGKITAIVGASGSGKTTLMKLLLKIYEPSQGSIFCGNSDLKSINQISWREVCGTVMQEGYIFSDSIEQNIAVTEGRIDKKRLQNAVHIANIKDFIDHLPLRFKTKIGQEGLGLSGGQKQRLLIARAIYKSPKLICFDEATSALDAQNERIIMENVQKFFEERTAVVIAHRLSTVRNAHQIVVLKEGKIIEKGNHENLLKQKGEYYNLVKNQLELEKVG